jgi:(R)-2-hydroxyglutarate---pyruvate transhydrogenase
MLLTHRAIFRRSFAPRRWSNAFSTQTRHVLNSVTHEDVEHFRKILPTGAVLSTLPPVSLASDELTQFNVDWIGRYHGKATTVLKPKTTQQVSDIVRYCYEKRIGVVPQGGNTGLVGGSVPLKDELIVNLGSMSNVRSFDPVSGKLSPAC